MGRPSRAGAAVFWSGAAILLLAGLGVPSLHGSEDRFAEIAREMVRSGDSFHPTLNGEPHFYKPLLSYWTIAAASRLLGEASELAARLPSALAALVALVATVRLGSHLWGIGAGRAAGVILLLSYGFLLWARTAAADMANLAATVLAVATFRVREGRPGVLSYMSVAMICAVGAQAKGLAAIVLPVLVILLHLLSTGRWREQLRPAPLALALALGAVVYLAPFLWAEHTRLHGDSLSSLFAGDPESGLYMVFQENVQRFFAPHDHIRPFYTYFLALPILLLPWTGVLVVGLATAARRWQALDAETRWVLGSVGVIFFVFSAAGSRRSYYILPILPFCSLFVAATVCRDGREHAVAEALRWTSRALVAVVVGEAVVGLLAVPFVPLPVVASAVGPVVAWWLVRRRLRKYAGHLASFLRVPSPLVTPLVLSTLVLGGYFVLQYPLLDGLRTEKPFALALRDATEGLPARRIAFVRHVPALFPFYLDAAGPITVLHDGEEVREFLEAGPGVVVASPRTLRSIGGPPDPLFRRPPDLREDLHPWNPVDERYGAWFVARRAVLESDSRS